MSNVEEEPDWLKIYTCAPVTLELDFPVGVNLTP